MKLIKNNQEAYMGWHDSHPIWDGLESIPDYSTTPFTIKCMKGSVTITASNRGWVGATGWAPSATHRGTDNTTIWSGTLSSITLQEGERLVFGDFPRSETSYGSNVYYNCTKITLSGTGRAKAYGNLNFLAAPYERSGEVNSVFQGNPLYDVSRVWGGVYEQVFDGLKNIKVTPIHHQISFGSSYTDPSTYNLDLFSHCTGLREAWMLCGYDGWRADLTLPNLPEGTNAVLHGNSAATPVLPTGWIYKPIPEINAPGAYFNNGFIYYETDSNGKVIDSKWNAPCEYGHLKNFKVSLVTAGSQPSVSKSNAYISISGIGSKLIVSDTDYSIPRALDDSLTILPDDTGVMNLDWTPFTDGGPHSVYRQVLLHASQMRDIYDAERQWKYW